mmetsp:Transcript_18054/g.41768  ORF Transcript_18054/g.41768 Transcript_18054/m.41768 type:complete len:210 (+) Transcript_18054:1190-1819(+)
MTENIGLILSLRRHTTRLHPRGPNRSVPTNKLSSVFTSVRVQVSRREVLESVAFSDQAFHFRRHINGAVITPTNVERRDSDVVPRKKEEVFTAIVEDETKHTAKLATEFGRRTKLIVKGQNHLTIRAGLWFVVNREGLVELLVVVDLSIGGNNHISIRRNKRLRSTFRIYDGKTLMSNTMRHCDSFLSLRVNDNVTGPVRATMAKFRRT